MWELGENSYCGAMGAVCKETVLSKAGVVLSRESDNRNLKLF